MVLCVANTTKASNVTLLEDPIGMGRGFEQTATRAILSFNDDFKMSKFDSEFPKFSVEFLVEFES